MNEKIRSLINESRTKSDDWERRLLEQEKKARRLEGIKRTEILPKMRPAKARDYKKWLKGFLARGGRPTHYSDYRFNKPRFRVGTGKVPGSWYVAEKDFKLPDLCGALSIDVIVPEGVNFLGGATGHCNIFYMDGYKAKRPNSVPVYTDTIV